MDGDPLHAEPREDEVSSVLQPDRASAVIAKAMKTYRFDLRIPPGFH